MFTIIIITAILTLLSYYSYNYNKAIFKEAVVKENISLIDGILFILCTIVPVLNILIMFGFKAFKYINMKIKSGFKLNWKMLINRFFEV